MMKLEPMPEQLLTVSDVCFFTRESRQQVMKRFKAGGEWHASAVLINGEYRVPVSVYNAWLAERRVCKS